MLSSWVLSHGLWVVTKEPFQRAETVEKTILSGFGSPTAAGSFIVLYQRSDTEKMAYSVGKTMELEPLVVQLPNFRFGDRVRALHMFNVSLWLEQNNTTYPSSLTLCLRQQSQSKLIICSGAT